MLPIWDGGMDGGLHRLPLIHSAQGRAQLNKEVE